MQVKGTCLTAARSKASFTSESKNDAPLVYLASPYSHSNPEVQEERFQAVCAQAAEMMRNGIFVFSPVSHSHPIAAYGLPGDWAYWQTYDSLMLSRCDKLVVLCLPGWKESVGVQAEIRIAQELGLPVSYISSTHFRQERECIKTGVE